MAGSSGMAGSRGIRNWFCPLYLLQAAFVSLQCSPAYTQGSADPTPGSADPTSGSADPTSGSVRDALLMRLYDVHGLQALLIRSLERAGKVRRSLDPAPPWVAATRSACAEHLASIRQQRLPLGLCVSAMRDLARGDVDLGEGDPGPEARPALFGRCVPAGRPSLPLTPR